MKKAGEWAKRHPWDIAACLLFLLVIVLILVNLSMFPVYLDMPYHLAASQAFIDSGGVTTWDWWEFAPAGRPHIYPPFLHVVMGVPLQLGISGQAVGTFFSLMMFPLMLLSLWWMVRQLFSSRQAFYSCLLLLIPYTFFWQTAVTTAAALVLALTPMIFLSLERKRWVTPAILLAVCLYSHLVMGHLVALALFIYLLHRREMWRNILKVLAAAYILFLPWGLNIALHFGSFSTTEAGGDASSIHLLIWMAAALALPVCYVKKGRYYLLASYFLSMIPIAFFYPNRFWEGHVFLPLAMLGGLFLNTLHDGLGRLFSSIPDLKRRAVQLAAASMGIILVPLLLLDPVVAWGGNKQPGQPGQMPYAGQSGPYLPGSGGPPPAGLSGPYAANPYKTNPYAALPGAAPYAVNPYAPGPNTPGYPAAGLPAAGRSAAGKDSVGLELRYTTPLNLLGVEDGRGMRAESRGEMFSQANLELCRIVEENTGPGDVVYVDDARLADLIFAETGRPVTSGMFREVSSEGQATPRDAALIIAPSAAGAPAAGNAVSGTAAVKPRTNAAAARAPGIAALEEKLGEPAAEVGQYAVYVNEQAAASVQPAGAALPLWAAYAVILIAGILIFLDQFLYFKRKKEGGPGGDLAPDEPALVEIVPAEDGQASFLVAIPCLNEEASIGQVVREVKYLAPEALVLVVDDGSRDSTAAEAAASGAAVVSNRRNRGIAGSLKRAFGLALASGHQWLARMDGDGQHDPAYLHALLEPLRSGEADVAVGSRYLNGDTGNDGSTTSLRRWSRRLFSLMVRLYTGRSFTDPNSGMWAYNRRSMDFLTDADLFDYPEGDMLITLERAGFKVAEVPVRMRSRRAGRSSLNPFKALGYLVQVAFHPIFDPSHTKQS